MQRPDCSIERPPFVVAPSLQRGRGFLRRIGVSLLQRMALEELSLSQEDDVGKTVTVPLFSYTTFHRLVGGAGLGFGPSKEILSLASACHSPLAYANLAFADRRLARRKVTRANRQHWAASEKVPLGAHSEFCLRRQKFLLSTPFAGVSRFRVAFRLRICAVSWSVSLSFRALACGGVGAANHAPWGISESLRLTPPNPFGGAEVNGLGPTGFVLGKGFFDRGYTSVWSSSFGRRGFRRSSLC